MKTYNRLSLVVALALPLNLAAAPSFAADAAARPTIVLVHGAFSDSSSLDGVTRKPIADGYPVIGAAKRAHAVKTLAIPGASRVVMISHPVEVAGLIEEAANAR